MRALFISRLQPLHLGHIHIIKKAIEKYGDVSIAIGSSDKKGIFENPFSFEERLEMVRRCFLGIRIIGIEDYPSDDEWSRVLISKIGFDVVVSGSGWVKKCLFRLKEVEKPEFLKPDIYNGTKIREKIARGEVWEDLVPEKVASYIKEIGGDKRIMGLKSSD